MKGNNWFWKIICLGMVCAMISCEGNRDSSSDADNGVLSGRTVILVDETILPIVEDQASVFESSYAKAELQLIAKPENEVINSLLKDSAQIAIIARELTKSELAFFAKKTISPRTVPFATDAIALITNRSNVDSTIKVTDILSIMKGQKVSGIQGLVFDNANSSTIAYFKKLAGVDALPKEGVYALKSNADILKYVNENPQSVGVLGINWIVQPSPELAGLVSNIRVLGVQNQGEKKDTTAYYTPTQSNLALNLYPFTRKLYAIDVQGKKSVGYGFSAFLHGERGQRMILKSGLLPDSIPSREIFIRK